MTRHKTIGTLGAGLAATWMMFAAPAFGQDSNMVAKAVPTSHPQERSTTIPSPEREAWMEAGNFAKANPAIGIAVYGRSNDATGEQVAQFIQGVFAKQGIPSKYFLADPERKGVGVSFYLKDTAYGPSGLDEAGNNVRMVISHFSHAWPSQSVSASAAPNTLVRN